MAFSTLVFPFVFLPVSLILYFVLPKRLKNAALVVCSLVFFAWGTPEYLVLMVLDIAFHYFAGRELALQKVRGRSGRFVLVSSVLVNLLLLGFFKYYGFLVDNLNALLGTALRARELPMPIGVSFFTFSLLSYLFDVYRDRAPAARNVLDFSLYVTFFPKLVSGPIVQYAEMEPQLRDHPVTREGFGSGARLFLIGLAKKVLLANTLGTTFYALSALPMTQLSTLSAWLGAVCYALMLYFDFSGYSDMAIGVGKMFRITIPENFNSPYKAVSVKDFWKRWHITLSSFLQTYIYFPLGGSRRGKARTIINTLITFLISGLWHGANWTFVFWGLLHGIGVAFNSLKLFSIKKKWLCRLFTFSYVCMAFVFFRADSLADGFHLLGRILSFQYNGSLVNLAAAMEPSEIYIVTKALSMMAPGLISLVQIGMMLLVTAISAVVLTRSTAQQITEQKKITGRFTIALAFLFAWSVISLSGVSSFVYFNF